MLSTKRQGKQQRCVQEDGGMKEGFLSPIQPSHYSEGEHSDSESGDDLRYSRRRRLPLNPRRGSCMNQSSLSDSFVLPRINMSPDDCHVGMVKKSKTLMNIYPKRNGMALPTSKSCPVLSNGSSAEFNEYEKDFMSMSFNVTSELRKHREGPSESRRKSKERTTRMARGEKEPLARNDDGFDFKKDFSLPDIFKPDSDLARDSSSSAEDLSTKNINRLKSKSIKRITKKKNSRLKSQATKKVIEIASSDVAADSDKEPQCPIAFEWESVRTSDDGTVTLDEDIVADNQNDARCRQKIREKNSKQRHGKPSNLKPIDKSITSDRKDVMFPDLTGNGAETNVKCRAWLSESNRHW